MALSWSIIILVKLSVVEATKSIMVDERWLLSSVHLIMTSAFDLGLIHKLEVKNNMSTWCRWWEIFAIKKNDQLLMSHIMIVMWCMPFSRLYRWLNLCKCIWQWMGRWLHHNGSVPRKKFLYVIALEIHSLKTADILTFFYEETSPILQTLSGKMWYNLH